MRLPFCLALSCALACDAEGGVDLGEANACSESNPCRGQATCLADRCIDDGSLIIGDTCNQEAQCGVGLVCHHFICKPGCTDVYYLDDCGEGLWCKPLEGASLPSEEGELPVGSCEPSECDPREGERCADPEIACVAISSDIGACLPYCSYGFTGATYDDTCTDGFELDSACQPLGLNRIPVCMEAGGDDAPAVGEPGCDAVFDPCAPGSVCINVVCRQLCTPGQAHPCPGEERCTPLGERLDIAYCKAE
jgi:hypothetical protein